MPNAMVSWSPAVSLDQLYSHTTVDSYPSSNPAEKVVMECSIRELSYSRLSPVLVSINTDKIVFILI